MPSALDAAIVGPGALGTVLAASLSRPGARVGLLCRDARRAAALRRAGLRVHGATARTVPPARLAVSHLAARLPPARVVLLCVKSADALKAARSAAPLLKQAEAAVCLQNGVTHQAPLARMLGRKAVFAAVWVGAFSEGPGRAVHAGGKAVGLAGGSPSARAAAARLLGAAGWKVRRLPSAQDLLWEKAAFNAALNPLAALTGMTNGELAADAPMAELLVRAAGEAQAVLESRGMRLKKGALAVRALAACRATPGNVNSMLADVRTGRPTEAPAILEPLLAQARRKGLPVPLLSALAGLMRRLEREIARG